jgi:hypothetical protein
VCGDSGTDFVLDIMQFFNNILDINQGNPDHQSGFLFFGQFEKQLPHQVLHTSEHLPQKNSCDVL